MPILLVVMGFDYDAAVALSLCTVFGNYGMQFLINRNKPHPTVPRRTMIYWEAVLIMMPAQLGGSSLGVVRRIIFFLFCSRLSHLFTYLHIQFFSVSRRL